VSELLANLVLGQDAPYPATVTADQVWILHCWRVLWMVTQIAVVRNPLRLFHLHPLIGQLMWNHVGAWRRTSREASLKFMRGHGRPSGACRSLCSVGRDISVLKTIRPHRHSGDKSRRLSSKGMGRQCGQQDARHRRHQGTRSVDGATVVGQDFVEDPIALGPGGDIAVACPSGQVAP
jgi:hypothetical protein